MSFAIAISLHLLSAIAWIGGMFFAYVCLRPSLPETLDPPHAARLVSASFGRFFRWVWAAVITLLLTGFYMAFIRYGFGVWPLWLYLMMGLGMVMMVLFAHVYFAPYRRLRRGLAASDPAAAGLAIAQIRTIVGVNLCIGIIVVISASAGRNW